MNKYQNPREKKYNKIIFYFSIQIKWKKHKVPTLMTVIKIIKNRRNKDKIETSNTYIHDCSLSWNGTDTSITSDEDQLVL